ncbi:MAG: hypothetical protein DDG59_04405 [Anaerolineae bacterium]|jgi:hypothetical protein|nr:MAG: hypothetical protein DDG59_04405 [Anaerolineae bacterium]
MSTRYDEKGKFFTDRVTKEQIPVMIQTIFGRIEGFFYVMAGARLKDEINNAEQFIAITNAKIYDLNGECEVLCEFLSLNRDHIVWLAPQSEVRFPSE